MALKEINVAMVDKPDMVAETWELEAKVLGKFHTRNRFNFLRCFAAIRIDDRYYLDFPWTAGGTLRDY